MDFYCYKILPNVHKQVKTVVLASQRFDPLEQFLFSNYLTIAGGMILILVITVYIYKNNLYILLIATKNHFYSVVLKGLYKFVFITVYGNITMTKQIYFPLFYFLFLLILIANVVGLIPYSFTSTSSFIVTLYLSLIVFIMVILTAIYSNGWKVGDLFLPKGVPLVIAPGVTNIEGISFFARVWSLAIRLFANMMSGHALIKILNGFSWALGTATKWLLKILSIIPWTIVTLVMFLETLIAFLQSYVFLTLSTIYVNDVINGH